MTAAVFCETKPQLVVRNVPVPSNRCDYARVDGHNSTLGTFMH